VFAAIYIHNFSLQSVLRHEPELIPKPVVLTDPALTKPCVTQLTPTARASGICEGMTPSQAMARCGNLVVKTRSLPQEQASMETLMQTAYAFSPHIEATAPGVCTIELKGLAIQTNEISAKQWATEILRVLKQFHLLGQIGLAEAPALALLAAHAARPILIAQRGRARCPHRAASDGTRTHVAQNDFVSRLPIEALDLPFESLEILKRWGINTAGAFLTLGKDALAERLGPAIVEVFDRLSTQSVRPLKIAAPPETFAEEIEFENEIETLEPLLFILRRFVEQLSRRIELLYLVVAELHLKLGLTSGATYERAFTIPSPTGNAETLFRVLHTHLETVRTDAPIATLRLSAKPGRSESHQFGLFETTLRNPNQFAETLARLTALCGSDRVGTPVLEATHRPDTFQIKAADFRTNTKKKRTARLRPVRVGPSRRAQKQCEYGKASFTSRRHWDHVPSQTENPKGIPPQSPGLPSLRGYPGIEASNVHNPERVASSARHSTVHGIQFLRGLPLRRFRPPLPARIEIRERSPVLMRSTLFNGVIADVRGPFLSSGNWWENNRWEREEWDIQTSDGTLYRIFRAAKEVGETVGRACSMRGAPCSVRIALAPPTIPTLDSNKHNSPAQSGRGQPHSPASAGFREIPGVQNLRQVLECGCPLPLSLEADKRAQYLESSQPDLSLRSQMVPPLPKGEGWGEREERVPLYRHGFEYFVEGIYD
jgi:protein ImuB